MSREPIRIDCDGLSRLVYPCSVEGCGNHCDPDFDSTFLCAAHLAMVPPDALAEIDWAFAEAMDGGISSDTVTRILDEALAYAVAADAVIHGDGL